MIKAILAIGHINYDEFLERILEMAKQHPEQMGGMKLPPFSGKMLKMIPSHKKNEMLAHALNSSKDKILPQAEMLLSRILGPVRLKDLAVNCENGGPDEVTVMLEFAEYNRFYLIDNFLPLYYSEYTAPQVLGENYQGSFELGTVQNYMKQQDPKTCQLLIAKSMSVNRSYLMQLLQNGAAAGGIELRMNNIRLMVK